MAILTADEFISLYQSNPKKALLWLQSKEMDLTRLFTSRDEVERLAAMYYAMLPSHNLSTEIIREIYEPIYYLVNAAGNQIADLYNTLSAFMKLVKISSGFASQLFKVAPAKIEVLFNSYNDFMALEEASISLASDLFHHNFPKVASFFQNFHQFMALEKAHSSLAADLLNKQTARVADFFTSYEQFMALETANSSRSYDLFRKAPAKIASFFTSFDQFMALETAHSSLAYDLFRHNPAKIASLFTTFEQFMALEVAHSSLASDLFKKAPDRIIGLFTKADQFIALEKAHYSIASDMVRHAPEKIALLFSTEDSLQRLAANNSSLADRISKARKTKNTSSHPTRQQARSYSRPDTYSPNPASAAHSFHDQAYTYSHASPTAPARTNYSFYLQVFGGLMATAGVGLIIAGIILAQPEFIGIGLIAAVVGAGIGFFSGKVTNQKPDEEEDLTFKFV